MILRVMIGRIASSAALTLFLTAVAQSHMTVLSSPVTSSVVVEDVGIRSWMGVVVGAVGLVVGLKGAAAAERPGFLLYVAAGYVRPWRIV